MGDNRHFGSPYEEDLVREIENRPSSVCRGCDYGPCMCGRRDYASDREYAERMKEQAERDTNDHPMGPYIPDMDDY